MADRDAEDRVAEMRPVTYWVIRTIEGHLEATGTQLLELWVPLSTFSALWPEIDQTGSGKTANGRLEINGVVIRGIS